AGCRRGTPGRRRRGRAARPSARRSRRRRRCGWRRSRRGGGGRRPRGARRGGGGSWGGFSEAEEGGDAAVAFVGDEEGAVGEEGHPLRPGVAARGESDGRREPAVGVEDGERPPAGGEHVDLLRPGVDGEGGGRERGRVGVEG